MIDKLSAFPFAFDKIRNFEVQKIAYTCPPLSGATPTHMNNDTLLRMQGNLSYLQRDKLRPVPVLAHVDDFLHLPRCEIASSEVPYLSCSYQVAQCRQGLFYRGSGVPTMNLQYIGFHIKTNIVFGSRVIHNFRYCNTVQ